ncbi:MAG: tandem-95 repeat protein [Leptolyngbya sp. SIO1E4]|nr:tandem-95 repeat protein [Leptolyngbya sp. SIO1E4]
MPDIPQPIYYPGELPIITGNTESLNDALTGAGSDGLIAALSEQFDVAKSQPGDSISLKFLKNATQSTASNFLAQGVEIAYDGSLDDFTISGRTVTDILGGAAINTALSSTATLALLSVLGPGAVVGVAAATGIAVVSSLVWSAISDATEVDDYIAEFIDEILVSARGDVPIDFQILDPNGNLLGGALYEEDIDETTEYEAITKLIQQSQTNSVIPQLTAGVNTIRAVEQTILSPKEREYRLYNGALVDEISEIFEISKFDLLLLGEKNEPNTNGQIYAPLLFDEGSFLFGATDNQFFVPLPDINGNVQPVGLYLGDIIFGTAGEDRLDAFQAFGERAGLDRFSQKQKVLLLGLDGDDTIDGNVDDDFIVGGEGNDTINGGPGTDVAIFSDDFDNYEPSLLADGSTIFSHTRGTQTDGIDTLRGVEFAKFRDRIVPLPLDIPVSNPEPEPSPVNRNINITQIGDDDIIPGTAIISGLYVYWEDDTDRVLSLNTDTQEIRDITVSGLSSEFLYDRQYEFTLGDGSSLLENDKIAVQLNSSSGQFINVAIYDGNSLWPIDAVQHISAASDRAFFEQNGFVYSYDYINQTSTLVADNNGTNSFTGLPNFPSSSFSSYDSSFSPDKAIAWTASRFGEIQFNIPEVFFYNGETTTQLTSYNSDLTDILSRVDFNSQYFTNTDDVYTDGNNVVWTSLPSSLADGLSNERVVFLYNGAEISQIGSFSDTRSNGLGNLPKVSGDNVVWSTITQATDTGNSNDYIHTLYLYDGFQTQAIHQVTRTHSNNSFDLERGIRKLQINGNNVAWLDRPTNPGASNNRLLYSYNIADENPQARIIHESEYELIHFEISENLTAWIAPENITVQQQNGREETYFSYNLYAYDGQQVYKLSDPASGPRSPGVRSSQLEVLNDRVIWVGESNGLVADPIISGDDEVFVATFGNVEEQTNSSPIANEDSFITVEGNTIAGNVLANDTDPDGDALTASLTKDVSNGTLFLNSSGSFIYQPDTSFKGADNFSYEISDGELTNIATVSITVVPVNNAPIANFADFSIDEDIGLEGTLTATDIDGDSLTFSLMTGAKNGAVVVNDNGSVIYTPDGNFFGTDSFSYTVTDGDLTDTGTANITVEPVNDAPVAGDDSFSAIQGKVLSGDVSTNDSDIDSNSLTFDLVSETSNGTISLNPDGTFSYSSVSDFTGVDSFTYKVSDGDLANIATVNINVELTDAAGLPSGEVANNSNSGIFSFEQWILWQTLRTGQGYESDTVDFNIERGGLRLASLFDETAYLDANPDVAVAVQQGIFTYGFEHFVLFGINENRAPSAWFNSDYYLSQNPDVAAAVSKGGSAISHFIDFGHREGRSPNASFDAKDYLTNNPDVATAVGSFGLDSAFEHYIEFGAEEGCQAGLLFQEVFYLQQNLDVLAAVQDGTFASGIEHFISFGQSEGRDPSALFDQSAYLERYGDVAVAVSSGALRSGFEHYVYFGRAEGRVAV